VHDTQSGMTKRTSLATGGTEGNGDSWFPVLSSDGLYVAFESTASNLVSDDTNEEFDVFLHENDFAPTVVSVNRDDPNPTTAASVGWTVSFSEDVTGVDTGDFVLTTDGSIGGASVTAVSCAGATYTVTASTGTGAGTLRLDIPATATITSLAGDPLSGLPYTGGQAYMILIQIYLPMLLRNAP
jgi:hypothetical protein